MIELFLNPCFIMGITLCVGMICAAVVTVVLIVMA
jgi:hypothetical protein